MNCDVWTIISALGTIGTFIVAGLVFYFERLRLRKENPKVTIWVNHQGYDGEITLFNSGRGPLPIKTLDIENSSSIIHSLFIGSSNSRFVKIESPMHLWVLFKLAQEALRCIVCPHVIQIQKSNRYKCFLAHALLPQTTHDHMIMTQLRKLQYPAS